MCQSSQVMLPLLRMRRHLSSGRPGRSMSMTRLVRTLRTTGSGGGKRYWQEHDYVFCTPVGTHIHPGHDILEEFKKLLKRAGLPDIRFHDLRHSAATMLLSMGVHPKIVQERLGDYDIDPTMDICSHVIPSRQDGAINLLYSVLRHPAK